MAYVDSIGIICYSQWVVYADPIDIICFSQWVACAVSFSFISFTCSASWRPVCSQWVVYAVSFVVLIFPVIDRSVWAALGLKRAARNGCVCFLIGFSKNNKSVSDWSIQVCLRAVARTACLACERAFPRNDEVNTPSRWATPAYS